MSRRLVIIVDGKDESDIEWLRTGAVAAVEEYIADIKDRGTILDDPDSIDVEWEWDDEMGDE